MQVSAEERNEWDGMYRWSRSGKKGEAVFLRLHHSTRKRLYIQFFELLKPIQFHQEVTLKSCDLDPVLTSHLFDYLYWCVLHTCLLVCIFCVCWEMTGCITSSQSLDRHGDSSIPPPTMWQTWWFQYTTSNFVTKGINDDLHLQKFAK